MSENMDHRNDTPGLEPFDKTMVIKNEPNDDLPQSCQHSMTDMDLHSHQNQMKQEDIDSGLITQPLQSPTTSSSKQPKKNKICLVCGDRAIGCNFGVISCESCKAFFRRMAFRTIRGRCKGDCVVDTESRVYCKSCRLKKCFRVGMKQDMILNDDERVKRQKRVKNEDSLSEPSSAWKMEELKYRDGTDSSSSHSSPESVVSWSEEDSKSLEIVNQAFNPMYEQTVNEEGLLPHPTTMDIVNMADISVRRLIKVAKGLEIFIKLSVRDQIELLKHCAIEMLILLSAPAFDTKTASWEPMQKPNAKVHSDQVQREGNEQMMDMMEGYGRYAAGLAQIMENDKNILHLLGVICLFSTDQIEMEHKAQIEVVQERFACLLERYIKKERPGVNLFPRLIMKLSDLKHLKDQHSKLLSSVEVHAIAPLLKELFNL
ncbi:vitamin D3 receptor-like isoform X2 [Lineus longissimus]|uniref:vitamin D3 receptor-like isoform X2 n=1 Tax=Lineus longissimus TaxID=88925 RepID=UPI002B4E40CC